MHIDEVVPAFNVVSHITETAFLSREFVIIRVFAIWKALVTVARAVKLTTRRMLVSRLSHDLTSAAKLETANKSSIEI